MYNFTIVIKSKKEKKSEAGEVVQRVKCQAAKTNDLSPMLRPTERKERTDFHELSSDLHIRAVVSHAHKSNK